MFFCWWLDDQRLKVTFRVCRERSNNRFGGNDRSVTRHWSCTDHRSVTSHRFGDNHRSGNNQRFGGNHRSSSSQGFGGNFRGGNRNSRLARGVSCIVSSFFGPSLNRKKTIRKFGDSLEVSFVHVSFNLLT